MIDLAETLDLLFPHTPYFGGNTRGQQISTLQSLCLSGLVSLATSADRPVRVLEVGSWTGFSSLTFAYAIAGRPQKGELVCVDKWEPYFAASDVAADPHYQAMEALLRTGLAFELFRHNIACAPPAIGISVYRQSSLDAMSSFPSESFDLVYLDGSHYYADVRADIEAAKRLLRDGGILCGDDLNVEVGQIDPERARRHIGRDCVTDDGLTFHPGVTLAVHEAVGPVSRVPPLWFAQFRQGSPCAIELAHGHFIIPGHFTSEQIEEAKRHLKPLA